jgi:hypothetical protein
MVRVVGPGGIVATCAWDMVGNGFPLDPILAEMRAMGLALPRPPWVDGSRLEALHGLWTAAGLQAVETGEIVLTRTFADFNDFWMTNVKSSTVAPTLAAPGDDENLKARVRARLSADSQGHVTCSARAHAVKGCRAR